MTAQTKIYKGLEQKPRWVFARIIAIIESSHVNAWHQIGNDRNVNWS